MNTATMLKIPPQITKISIDSPKIKIAKKAAAIGTINI